MKRHGSKSPIVNKLFKIQKTNHPSYLHPSKKKILPKKCSTFGVRVAWKSIFAKTYQTLHLKGAYPI